MNANLTKNSEIMVYHNGFHQNQPFIKWHFGRLIPTLIFQNIFSQPLFMVSATHLKQCIQQQNPSIALRPEDKNYSSFFWIKSF